MLHVLLHMDQRGAPMTSDEIANVLDTHSALVRRTMGGLRERGHVAAAKGRGGGWTLTQSLTEISLLDVHEALGMPTLFAVGTASDAPSCLMEQSANAAIETALEEAEALFLERLSSVTVADLACDFEARYALLER